MTKQTKKLSLNQICPADSERPKRKCREISHIECLQLSGGCQAKRVFLKKLGEFMEAKKQ